MSDLERRHLESRVDELCDDVDSARAERDELRDRLDRLVMDLRRARLELREARTERDQLRAETHRPAGVAAVSGQTPADKEIIGWARSTAKLYALAVVDDVAAAVARLATDIAGIRSKYARELDPKDPFRMLLKVATTAGWVGQEPDKQQNHEHG